MDNARMLFCVGGLALTAIVYAWAMFNLFVVNKDNTIKRIGLLVILLFSAVGILIALVDCNVPPVWRVVVCVVVLFVSNGFFWSAILSHRTKPAAAYAQDAPETIVTSGPYAYVRHPLYLSYILAFAAGAVLTPFLYPWVGPSALVVIYYLTATSEERLILASDQKDQYQQYRQSAGLLLPKFVRANRKGDAKHQAEHSKI